MELIEIVTLAILMISTLFEVALTCGLVAIGIYKIFLAKQKKGST